METNGKFAKNDKLSFITDQKLLKKHRYPPEGMDDAVQTVMTQCEIWTDNTDMKEREHKVVDYSFRSEQSLSMVAEDTTPYGKKK